MAMGMEVDEMADADRCNAFCVSGGWNEQAMANGAIRMEWNEEIYTVTNESILKKGTG